MKLFSSKVLLCFALAGLIPMSAFALGTDRAKGTPLNNPKDGVNAQQCLMCHTTVNKLHTRGAHKDVNCSSCHTVKSEHMTTPSSKNRPTTRFDSAACSQCHKSEEKDLMDPKYHYEWALKYAPPAYSEFRDIAGDNLFRDVQYRLPRFHSSIVTDLANVRSDGRYEYKDYKDLSKPGKPMWEALVDTRPEEGDNIKPSKTLSLTWRPHKGREVMGRSDCLKCKTSDNLMDYAYLGVDGKGAPLVFTDPDAKVLKTVNNSFNCITCHDPHSAEPRVTFDHLIETATHPDFKDMPYQKNAGSKAYPKMEIIEMGARGYPRKIGILESYNSNFMCGQCHMGHNRSETFFDDKTGKMVNPADQKQRTGWWVGTTFAGNPLDRWDIVRGKGQYNGIDPDTGVKKVSTDHYHMEFVAASKHGQAGVGCSDCHFAKKADGSLEHQPSLPSLKYANTCARSDCHGNPKGDNWSAGQAAYMVQTIQQRYRIHRERMERFGMDARKVLMQAKKGEVTIPEPQYQKLKDAYSRYLMTRDAYFGDYSKGVHFPSEFEKTSSTMIKDLRAATNEAKKTLKPAKAS